jgi:eukaryotic-like serine/threonine-protein kinase
MATPNPEADRNLLYGILALQMDFITREALVGAMNAWVLDKGKPLGRILLAQGALDEEDHVLLDAMVAKHVAKHGGDPQKSLAACGSSSKTRESLGRIEDADVQASLAHSFATVDDDPYRTQMPSIGTPTSSGRRFTILRPHAKGGLGVVFVAHDGELRREVALKEIQERHADNPHSQARFLLEAEVTGGLEHPGIVPVYGLGQYEDGRPFYAMRFIRGNTLDDEIRRFHEVEEGNQDPGERELAFRKLLRRFVDVCNAIEYAHSRGVLHRDVKPANIMIGGYGETLVVDWGLAKILDRPCDLKMTGQPPIVPSSVSDLAETMAGSAIGTPQFMSPEQAEGRLEEMGPPSDVYSLGATLYVMLTGNPPFGRLRLDDLMARIQQGKINPPRRVNRSVPRALEAICLKAMATAPGDRYPSPKELADEVESWMADERVRAHREMPFMEILRRLRKRPVRLAWLMVLAALNFLALPAFLAVWMSNDTLRTINHDFGVEFGDRFMLPPLFVGSLQRQIASAVIWKVIPLVAAVGIAFVPAEIGACVGFVLDSLMSKIRRLATPRRAMTVVFAMLGLVFGVLYSYESMKNLQFFVELMANMSH